MASSRPQTGLFINNVFLFACLFWRTPDVRCMELQCTQRYTGHLHGDGTKVRVMSAIIGFALMQTLCAHTENHQQTLTFLCLHTPCALGGLWAGCHLHYDASADLVSVYNSFLKLQLKTPSKRAFFVSSMAHDVTDNTKEMTVRQLIRFDWWQSITLYLNTFAHVGNWSPFFICSVWGLVIITISLVHHHFRSESHSSTFI